MTHPAVRVWAEGRPDQIGPFTWLHLTLVEGLPDAEATDWGTSQEDLGVLVHTADEAGEVVFRLRTSRKDTALVRLEGCLVLASLFAGDISCLISGPDVHAVQKAMDRVREWVPERATSESLQLVPLTVWHFQKDAGGIHRTREIRVPRWDEVEENYASSTRGALAPLVEGMAPGEGGRLILWHGRPGTGKTYAVRALAWEWRDWADFHYVSDPEVLFGREPSYLFEVILDAPKPRGRGAQEADRWKVLILEDMGELLAPDARVQMGQGLSRVLNLMDGLLGQGLRLLMLVTTNEPLDRIHPAVARPGRCAASVEFTELPPSEVDAWFVSRDREVPEELRGVSATIATLHAALESRLEPKARQQAVGFSP